MIYLPKINILVLVLLSIILWPNKAFSQNLNNIYSISGTVIDSATLKPIQFTEVFISGTTVGTVTDENGNFSLNPPYMPCQIVVTHLGYQVVILNILNEGSLNIKLSTRTIGIGEVNVKAKNNRRHNLNLFNEYFIGSDMDGNYKILNDSVLQFLTDDFDYHAYTNIPLIVQNDYLGYQIKIFIKDFYLCRKTVSKREKVKLKSSKGLIVMKLVGYFYYQPYQIDDPGDANRIEDNRLKHYFGSTRHFLKALYDNRLRQEGYTVKVQSEKNSLNGFICTQTYPHSKLYYISADTINIDYKTDVQNHNPLDLTQNYDRWFNYESTIFPTQKEFIIRDNGTTPEAPFEIMGVMGQKRMVNSLPDDYVPRR